MRFPQLFYFPFLTEIEFSVGTVDVGVGGIINSNTSLGVFTIYPNNGGLSGLSLVGFNGSRLGIDAAGRFLYATDKSNPGNVAGYIINSSS